MNPVTPTGDLLRAAQTGDHRAFTDLIRGCDDRMRTLAFRLLGSQAAMDDALQDAYLKAYRKIGTFHGDATFSTWLYSIVYRTCLDHLRTRGRRKETNLDTHPEPNNRGADLGDQVADADALDQVLRDLPPDQAAAVLLVDGDGCTYEEAAAVLGVRAGTIASRLHRAHQSLRHTLTINTDEGSRP